jgi:aspartyl-tRNA(Asn)/glutamyl-tRNA(Gln) amidotransferase subunit C
MDDQTVRTICYLSRLRLDDEKSKKILSDLDTIIGMIDSLSSTNTDNIYPLYNPLEETARKFNDKIKSDNNKKLFLENAPESDENFFLVPKVVD